MKAIVQSAYGEPEEVLSLQEVDVPGFNDDEILVRVRASSVHADVWHTVTGLPYILRIMGAGVRRPNKAIPGTDFAGVVESVGATVTSFKPGDEVLGECIKGNQWTNGGAYAEFAVVRPEWTTRKPPGVTFEQAAAVPTAGLIVWSNLVHLGRLASGQKVLINGAGGGVGLFAVQIALAFGAEVTAVDDAAHGDLLRSAGATRVVDYMKEDFTSGTERFDLILDIPGNHPFSRIKRVLAPTGIYIPVGHDAYGRHGRRVLGSIPKIFGLIARSRFSRHLPKSWFSTPDKKESLERLRELLESGKITPIIGKTFPLGEAAQAIRYLAAGQAVGRVVLTVQ